MRFRIRHRLVLPSALVMVVTLSAAPVAAASPPATNGAVLLHRDVDGRGELVGSTVDGAERVLSTLDAPASRLEAIGSSPEGRRLAWLRHLDVDGRRRSVLAVSNADGTRRSDAHDLGLRVTGATWLPDGRSLAYLQDDRVLVVPADGASAPVSLDVALPDGPLRGLHWSPRGDRFLVVAAGADGEAVWSVTLTGEHRRLAGPAADGRSPYAARWSPDGQQVAVLVEDPFSLDCTFRDLMLVAADGTRARSTAAISPRPCWVGGLRWSPDGDQLLVHAAPLESGPRLWRVPLAGGGPQPVGADVPGRWDHVVDWVPVPDLIATICPRGSVPAAGFADAVGTAHERGIDCAVHLGVAFGRDATTFAPGAPVDRAQLASFVARTLEVAGVELPTPQVPAFDDLGDSVHAERIEQLAALGVVAGVGERRFEPARPVTRAQLATFLVNAHRIAGGEPLPAMPDAFVDDAGTHERAIDAAAAAGLLTGFDEQRFGPTGQVQRGQMASALSRLLDRFAREGRLPVATTG